MPSSHSVPADRADARAKQQNDRRRRGGRRSAMYPASAIDGYVSGLKIGVPDLAERPAARARRVITVQATRSALNEVRVRSHDHAREHHQPVVDPDVEERAQAAVLRREERDGRERGEARGGCHARQVDPPAIRGISGRESALRDFFLSDLTRIDGPVRPTPVLPSRHDARDRGVRSRVPRRARARHVHPTPALDRVSRPRQLHGAARAVRDGRGRCAPPPCSPSSRSLGLVAESMRETFALLVGRY